MTTVKLHSSAINYSKETEAILKKINRMEVKTYADSHTNNLETCKFDGYVILKGTNENFEYVCPLLAGKVFCLNEMHLNAQGDALILSRRSVGGTIDARNKTLEEAIQVYRDYESPWIPTLVEYKIWD